ncbi:MAG TPA: 30S ribosomal protein S8 [Planctomycetota bacterium]|jgi:small subunit ribosomal protein S8|nr:30S ribosomal protein S8 [Planctomycetota bacterium]MDP7245999.1 30S ribosomal protein S8 [Planctomycetota bacterium]HJM38953.1 30S ribosomal protein S8 [Planctomycetota bacterium]|tara:strand:- start:7039 stop:7440 length:402 start_codon:yes stop_codon:yes gene_type:complete
MTTTDPIADMLTRIRNGLMVRKRFVDVPSSRTKSSIALTLKEEGYLVDVEPVSNDKGFSDLRVRLKYDEDGVPVIQEICRVSKPGCRVYASCSDIPEVRRGLGTTILSTSKGIMSGQKAQEAGVGGEVLFTVF